MYALVDRKWLSQAGPSATSCSLSLGLCQVVLGVAAGQSDVGHHQGGEGPTRQARLGPPEKDTKVFHKPRHQWEWTKEFQGNSSIFQSQT